MFRKLYTNQEVFVLALLLTLGGLPLSVVAATNGDLILALCLSVVGVAGAAVVVSGTHHIWTRITEARAERRRQTVAVPQPRVRGWRHTPVPGAIRVAVYGCRVFAIVLVGAAVVASIQNTTWTNGTANLVGVVVLAVLLAMAGAFERAARRLRRDANPAMLQGLCGAIVAITATALGRGLADFRPDDAVQFGVITVVTIILITVGWLPSTASGRAWITTAREATSAAPGAEVVTPRLPSENHDIGTPPAAKM